MSRKPQAGEGAYNRTSELDLRDLLPLLETIQESLSGLDRIVGHWKRWGHHNEAAKLDHAVTHARLALTNLSETIREVSS